MRILIAEDEVATARALQVLLRKNHYTVDIVYNGNDAWDYISTNVSFLVLGASLIIAGKYKRQ